MYMERGVFQVEIIAIVFDLIFSSLGLLELISSASSVWGSTRGFQVSRAFGSKLKEGLASQQISANQNQEPGKLGA